MPVKHFMNRLEVRADDLCIGLEQDGGKVQLTLSHLWEGQCAFPCSAANLLSVCAGRLRYHVAGADGELTLQKVGGHVMMSLERNGARDVYKIAVEVFREAILRSTWHSLKPEKALAQRGYLL